MCIRDRARALQLELAGPFVPGWNRRSVDLSGLSNGLYFVTALPSRAGVKGKAAPPARLMLAR